MNRLKAAVVGSLRLLWPPHAFAAAKKLVQSLFAGRGKGAPLAGKGPQSISLALGLEVMLHGLSKQELNGQRGTIASSSANSKGRWDVRVEASDGVEARIIALKLSNLIWKGRLVQLCGMASALDFDKSYGSVSSAKPDEAGRWDVEVTKRLNLKPGNIELQMESSGEVRQGSCIVVRGLQSSPTYNGLSARVQAEKLSEQGRWEVEVSKTLAAPLDHLKMVWASEVFGEFLITKSGKKLTNDVLDGKRVVLVYFSAHWCPPCKAFTPLLATAYSKHSANDVEVVFVSSDRDNASFESYYGEMPWAAIPYADRSLHAKLSSSFQVGGIPMLVVLGGVDGSVVTTNGRGDVQATGDLAKCMTLWGC